MADTPGNRPGGRGIDPLGGGRDRPRSLADLERAAQEMDSSAPEQDVPLMPRAARRSGPSVSPTALAGIYLVVGAAGIIWAAVALGAGMSDLREQAIDAVQEVQIFFGFVIAAGGLLLGLATVGAWLGRAWGSIAFAALIAITATTVLGANALAGQLTAVRTVDGSKCELVMAVTVKDQKYVSKGRTPVFVCGADAILAQKSGGN